MNNTTFLLIFIFACHLASGLSNWVECPLAFEVERCVLSLSFIIFEFIISSKFRVFKKSLLLSNIPSPSNWYSRSHSSSLLLFDCQYLYEEIRFSNMHGIPFKAGNKVMKMDEMCWKFGTHLLWLKCSSKVSSLVIRVTILFSLNTWKIRFLIILGRRNRI